MAGKHIQWMTFLLLCLGTLCPVMATSMSLYSCPASVTDTTTSWKISWL